MWLNVQKSAEVIVSGYFFKKRAREGLNDRRFSKTEGHEEI